jgi:hypothetical protein
MNYAGSNLSILPLEELPGSFSASEQEHLLRWQAANPCHYRQWKKENLLSTARDRCKEMVIDAFESGDYVLVDALPTLGKSHGTVAAAEHTELPTTILMGRGHKEQYGQYREWCAERDLSCYRLPSFHEDCPTANGQNGDDWKERLHDCHNRGLSASLIHEELEPPCVDSGSCPYEAKLNFDPDSFDVLIGHYRHAHFPKVTNGRVVALDEYPGGAFLTSFERDFSGRVTRFLDTATKIPYGSYIDLIAGRDNSRELQKALDVLEREYINGRWTHAVLNDPDKHALTPRLVYRLLQCVRLDADWEIHIDGSGTRMAHDKYHESVHLLDPPDFSNPCAVIGLDGTPTWWLWNLVLGGIDRNRLLTHRRVLSESERRDFLDVRYQIYQTSNNQVAYAGGNGINAQRDGALLRAISQRYGEKPALITSKKAEDIHGQQGISGEVSTTRHYGNLKGSNQLKEKELGVVIGSTHYGPKFVRKWAALSCMPVGSPQPGTSGSMRSIEEEILKHMREHQVLQAILRFGRDKNGATVFVHTNAIPDWVPVINSVISSILPHTENRLGVINALRSFDQPSTSEIRGYPDVNCSQQQVRNILNDLQSRGFVEKIDQVSGYEWRAIRLDEMNPYGWVDGLPP